MPMGKVAIIGGGISGIMLSYRLKQKGFGSTIFEKSRGVGGRMATKRWKEKSYDHGCQYFTATKPETISLLHELETENVVEIWSRGFSNLSGSQQGDQQKRWISRKGMTAVAKHLSKNLDINKQTQIVRINYDNDQWSLQTDDQHYSGFNALAFTCPVPQTLSIINDSKISLNNDIAQQLGDINYQPCIAILIDLKGPSNLPKPGGLWLEGEPFIWVADNSLKGLNDCESSSLVVHCGPQFSSDNIDKSTDEIWKLISSKLVGYEFGKICDHKIHRWRYSFPTTRHPDKSVLLDEPGLLGFAGDAFGESKVQGAILSGTNLAEDMADRL